MNSPSFSVIVLCYKHFEYLRAAVDSVLSQDYECIELIISDDGSPSFPSVEIHEYIEKRRGANIVNLVVRQEEKNCGTVKHLNHAIKCCTGEYIVALAGDDVFSDDTVLTQYVRGFSKAPTDCFIEMAQTGMYDEKLRNLEGYYLKLPVQKALEKTAVGTKEGSKELLECLLSKGPCLPSTSTCFKSAFFQKFGFFDERYTLVEDYPMHLRLAMEGWTIHYENFVAIKHRHGGISHGQSGASIQASSTYYSDLRAIIKEWILPNLALLPDNVAILVKKFQLQQLRWIEAYLAFNQRNYIRIACLALRYPFWAVQHVLSKLYPVANKIRTTILIPCLALWICIPTIGRMIDQEPVNVFHVTNEQVVFTLYWCTGVLFAIWCVSFFIWALNMLIWKIQRFPYEVVAIG